MADDGWPSYGTSEEKAYRFRPIEGKALRFKVKAAHDCHLAFSAEGEDTTEMFEVFIGAWEGAASAIRFKKDTDLEKVDTPDILNEDEIKEFWVTFDEGNVRVGYGGENTPFIQAQLPEPINVTHYGYSTGWGATGWWQFYHDRIIMSEDCDTYKFQPIYGTSLTFSVECTNDSHIALTSGSEETERMYEIFIGGWENQKSAIRLDKDKDQTVAVVETPDIHCGEGYRNFVVSFKDGYIKVYHKGDPEPFLEYEDPDPRTITHYGYRTCWGATGKWKLEQ